MFSTSMRKCSAVVFRDAPAWFAAEFLSSVFASVPLVIVILLFALWFFSDSIRLISRRTATPRSRRRSVPAAPTRTGYPVTAECPHEFAFVGRLTAGAFRRAAPPQPPRELAPSAAATHTQHFLRI